MNSYKHLYYWIIPTLFTGICMWIYFFDILGLSYFIAPTINREFGLLENTQLLILLGVIFVSAKSLFKLNAFSMKLLFGVILLGSIFMFLEEIDYGLHIYEYFMHSSAIDKGESAKKIEIRNIHNQGRITHYMKLFAYISLVAFFGLLPLIAKRIKNLNKHVKALIPSIYFILTLVSMLVLNQLAYAIDKTIKSVDISSLNHNTSEFEETYIYYIILLYIITLSSNLIQIEKEKG